MLSHLCRGLAPPSVVCRLFETLRSFQADCKSARTGANLPKQNTSALSSLFAFGCVLTAFFRLCGTNVHRGQKKALFLIAADNQWLREGRFLSKCKGSTIEALLADKFGIENGDFLRGESVYATGSIGLHNVEYRPTLHGASAEAPRDIVFRTIKKRKIMSRFFGREGKGEEAYGQQIGLTTSTLSPRALMKR